jgi:hypothetical protein
MSTSGLYVCLYVEGTTNFSSSTSFLGNYSLQMLEILTLCFDMSSEGIYFHMNPMCLSVEHFNMRRREGITSKHWPTDFFAVLVTRLNFMD